QPTTSSPLFPYTTLFRSKTLREIGFTEAPRPDVYSVKEAVLPFLKFRNVLPVLGPEMRSTGESMGIDADPDLAYYRAALGAGSIDRKSTRLNSSHVKISY